MIKVAVIGAGFMGSMHAEIYKHFPDIKIAGIVDSRGEKAKSLAEKVGSIPFYDAEQIFAREDITLIDVCLPTYLHKEFVLKAAEAGKAASGSSSSPGGSGCGARLALTKTCSSPSTR